jgi:hypothetical protein
MNRALDGVFHFAMQSSSQTAVNEMWKLCKARQESEPGANYSRGSEANGTDF